MDLFDNPFYILNVSITDNRHCLEMSADELILLSDPEICNKARDILIHPRKRISAEVGWLPGLAYANVNEILELLESSAGNNEMFGNSTSVSSVDTFSNAFDSILPTKSNNTADVVLSLLKPSEEYCFEGFALDIGKLKSIENSIGLDNIVPITRANLIAARILRFSSFCTKDIVKWILELAWVFEEIDAEVVLNILNQERIKAEFPIITDKSTIELELKNRRTYFVYVIRSVLTKLSPLEIVNAVQFSVDSILNGVNESWPILIEKMIDDYEDNIQEYLIKYEEYLETLNLKLQTLVENEIEEGGTNSSLVDLEKSIKVIEIITCLNQWGNIVRPILINRKRRGQQHEVSSRFTNRVRHMSIHLYNEYDEIEIALQLLNTLFEVLQGIPELIDRVSIDIQTLNKIVEQRK